VTEARLSAVVVTHLGGDLLAGCLASLAAQAEPPEEVVVALSGPGRAADAAVAACGLPVHLVRRPEPSHYARTANAGIAAARGDLVLVVNDDVRALPGCLAALRRAARAGDALWQPRILLADGSGRLDNVGHGLFPDGFNLARGRGAPDGPAFDTPGTVGAVSGAALLVPRAVLERVGSFDEAFGAFGEDVDLSLRAVRRGVPLRVVPDARVEHVLGASYGRNGLAKVFLVERNRVRAALRSLPATACLGLPLWTALRWALLAAAALSGRGVGADLSPAAAPVAVAGALVGFAGAPGALARRRRDAAGWVLGETAMWRHLWRERVRLADVGRRSAGPAPLSGGWPAPS